MVDDITRLRSRVDFLVASFHWGLSGSNALANYQRELARVAIDSGADIVIGHGPHKLQAVEVWKGKPIFYSLANFVFDWERMRTSRDGLLVRCVIEGRKLSRVSFMPLRRNADNDPVFLDPNQGEGRNMVELIKALSTDSGTEFEIKDTRVALGGLSRAIQ